MIMLDELINQVSQLTTAVDSAAALIDGLQDKVANLEPNQAAIDALAAEIAGNKAKLIKAMEANVFSPSGNG